MNTPISFLIISSEYISEEPLIVEAQVEGYLVRQVYVDECSSVNLMFEHCFKNLEVKTKARLKETQMDLVGFAWEISKPLGKIELEVCFGNGGLCRRTSMKFIMFPTPKGVATLVTRTVIIAECRRLEKKQMIEESSKGEKGLYMTEEVLVNPSFPDQRVTIGGRLLKAFRDQLKCLLKDNMGVFAWEPSNMTDAYKGYHRIQMAKEDKEEMAFYTNQGTRNLEAYVDDMVIKSIDEKMLLANIVETFDNLKKINMKLNPKKCYFGVEEGKFLGCMVTSEGIRANPKKTKALTDLQSPRTLKEM
ncbi:hypothetical protein Tco_1232600 [Tanacetum coccineum]